MTQQGEVSFSKAGLEKSHEILTCTVKNAPWSYAHMELVTESTEPLELDDLQVKSYCTAALRQSFGLSGQAMPLDILKTSGSQCWVRVPREDLSTFTAAITAWAGLVENGQRRVLRLKQASDWLGTMVGSDGQERLWES